MPLCDLHCTNIYMFDSTLMTFTGLLIQNAVIWSLLNRFKEPLRTASVTLSVQVHMWESACFINNINLQSWRQNLTLETEPETASFSVNWKYWRKLARLSVLQIFIGTDDLKKKKGKKEKKKKGQITHPQSGLITRIGKPLEKIIGCDPTEISAKYHLNT